MSAARFRKRIIQSDPVFEPEVSNLSDSFSPKQLQALNNEISIPNIDEICWDGGARSGKTYLAIQVIVGRAIHAPGSRHLIARYRLNHLRISVWRQTLIPMLKSMGLKKGRDYEVNSQDHILTFTHNGSEIYGVGLDDADRVEKVMGTEFNTIFINEATQVSYPTYQKVVSRLSLVNPAIKNFMLVDCNPRNKFHWIYKYFILRQDPENGQALPEARIQKIARRNWTPLDNPYLPKEYVERLSELTGSELDRLYRGLWVNVQGLVYPTFEQNIVEDFPIPEEWDCAGAVDFGYTNPYVFLWFHYDKSNETWYLTSEHYEKEKTVRWHCEEIKKYKIPNLWIVSDHDAEDRATMAELGIPTQAADKDVSTGIQAVITMLTQEKGVKLKIFRSCVKTIEEGATYSWEDQKEGRNAKEVPKKDLDHAMDALRYFALKVIGKKRTILTMNPDKLKEKEQERQQTQRTAKDIQNDRLRRLGLDPNLFGKR
jgi:phage terminase large subunit